MTDDAESGERTEAVGSVAEEAARLFAAFQERLGAHDGASVECRACPLCQALSAVRTVRPEVVEHLVEAAGSVTAALRAAFDRSVQHEGDDRWAEDTDTCARSAAHRVEHIEVR